MYLLYIYLNIYVYVCYLLIKLTAGTINFSSVSTRFYFLIRTEAALFTIGVNNNRYN